MQRYYVTYEDRIQSNAQIKHLKRLCVDTTQILRRFVPSGEILCSPADSMSTIFPVLGIREAEKKFCVLIFHGIKFCKRSGYPKHRTNHI